MLHKIHPDVRNLISDLQNAGFETYIVGGAVRDLLLDRSPKDYDVSTSATPEEVRELFGRKRAIIIGKRFRLVHVSTTKHLVEVSTFRRAPAQTSTHVASKGTPNIIRDDNEYGTALEDAYRRDFTVNAIFYDPVADQLYDFTKQGLNDLESGIVRVIGNPRIRFEEDPVRILRALKLVGQYHFKIEHDTADAMLYCMRMITHVSSSRLALELEKIFRSPYGHDILLAFKEYGLLKFLMPWLDMQWGSPVCDYALALFNAYNKRIRLGAFKDSASLAIASLVLPFIEKKYGLGKMGSLWEKSHEIKYHISDIIDTFLHPHSFCARITSSSLYMLLLQVDFKLFTGDTHVLTQSKSYVRARELFIIQNEVLYQDASVASKFPPPSPHFFSKKEENTFHPPAHKKRYKPRKQQRHGPSPKHIPTE